MRVKQSGISVFIAMGTSLMVLTLAFATLNSISRSLDQASNIQRSTQLFFASESGAEAAFFHHNSRGAGLSFPGPHASQTINHDDVDATTNWSLQGRTTGTDTGDPSGGNATIVELLKEGETLKIPLLWDSSSSPMEDPPTITSSQYDNPNPSTYNISLEFFRDPDDIDSSSAKDIFDAKYNFSSSVFPIASSFTFDGVDDETILIDWSLTRKHSADGVQTFIPTSNRDCNGFDSEGGGYICKNDFNNHGMQLQLDTEDNINGKVLPGSHDATLASFWRCNDSTVSIGFDTCSDYQITVRPLLRFRDGDNKIPGIPYELTLGQGSYPFSVSVTPKAFPTNTYTVTSDVTLEDFSQQIQIEVPEKTSIGAFDYVIFD